MKTSVKGFMFYVAFVASLGGLLSGFDTAVISGAEKAIQGIYALSDFAHGFTIATALIGTIVGALVCGGPAERYGRLRSLKVIAWLYLISAVGSAVIVNWYSFMFFRFLGGLAVGASSVVGPMYIAEISPSHWRGRFVAFFQFNIVLGIVMILDPFGTMETLVMAIGIILIIEGAINLLSALYTVLAVRRFAKLHPETQSMLESLTGEDLNGDGVVAPDVTRTDAEASAVELDEVDESATVEQENEK